LEGRITVALLPDFRRRKPPLFRIGQTVILAEKMAAWELEISSEIPG
jgi:hypothetical protein